MGPSEKFQIREARGWVFKQKPDESVQNPSAFRSFGRETVLPGPPLTCLATIRHPGSRSPVPTGFRPDLRALRKLSWERPGVRAAGRSQVDGRGGALGSRSSLWSWGSLSCGGREGSWGPGRVRGVGLPEHTRVAPLGPGVALERGSPGPPHCCVLQPSLSPDRASRCPAPAGPCDAVTPCVARLSGVVFSPAHRPSRHGLSEPRGGPRASPGQQLLQPAESGCSMLPTPQVPVPPPWG